MAWLDGEKWGIPDARNVVFGILRASAGRDRAGGGDRAQSALQAGHKLGELSVTLPAAVRISTIGS
jgi:hypothetical protein